MVTETLQNQFFSDFIFNFSFWKKFNHKKNIGYNQYERRLECKWVEIIAKG